MRMSWPLAGRAQLPWCAVTETQPGPGVMIDPGSVTTVEPGVPTSVAFTRLASPAPATNCNVPPGSTYSFDADAVDTAPSRHAPATTHTAVARRLRPSGPSRAVRSPALMPFPLLSLAPDLLIWSGPADALIRPAAGTGRFSCLPVASADRPPGGNRDAHIRHAGTSRPRGRARRGGPAAVGRG